MVGGGSHYNKEALCTVEYMCCSKLSKFWKFGRKVFFFGGGEGSTLHIMTKNCTALSIDCVVAGCI